MESPRIPTVLFAYWYDRNGTSASPRGRAARFRQVIMLAWYIAIMLLDFTRRSRSLLIRTHPVQITWLAPCCQAGAGTAPLRASYSDRPASPPSSQHRSARPCPDPAAAHTLAPWGKQQARLQSAGTSRRLLDLSPSLPNHPERLDIPIEPPAQPDPGADLPTERGGEVRDPELGAAGNPEIGDVAYGDQYPIDRRHPVHPPHLEPLQPERPRVRARPPPIPTRSSPPALRSGAA